MGSCQKHMTESEAKKQNFLGWTPEIVELFRDMRNKITAPVSNAVNDILGKNPRRFEDYIIENISLWVNT